MNLLHRFGLLLALEMAVLAQGDPGVLWTAYNDQYVGVSRAKYTTAWNMFYLYFGGVPNTGKLINSANGNSLPVVITLSFSGNAGPFPNSADPKPGTPVDVLFGDHVDWSRTYEGYMPAMVAGGSFSYVFSKLDTNKLYRFVGSGVLGGDYASSPGWTMVTLTGAESSTPKHSTGASLYTNGLSAVQAAINIGQNRDSGDYVCWENIKPTSKGTFTITCTRYGGKVPLNGELAFGLVAVRLQECIPANTPVFFSVQPTNQTVIELTSVNFHSKALGNPEPTYQWFRNGMAVSGATNDTYSLDYAMMSDDQSDYYVVANNTVSNVTYTATSQAARLTVLLDTNPPAMYRVLPPPKAAISSLTTIEVLFDKPVSGVSVSDLLINGVPATNLIQATSAQYLFEFPQPALGTVQVAWSESQQVRDISTSSNRFPGGAWTYNFTTNLLDFISINEIMAANKHGIRDEDGDYSDWIELYNTGLSSVPLTGCFLTSDPASLQQWQIPPFVMPPQSYVVIWASGKDRTNSIAPLHTNFKLEKQGGYLALMAPNGIQVVSSYSPSYPAQRTDVSYGLDRTDPSIQGFFTAPTPGAPNSTSGADFGPDVRFSRDSGTFISPFELRLSASLTNAEIRYVLGTNTPTSSSTLYTGPITIDKTTQVRARTFVQGLFPGEIKSHDYIYLDTTTTNVTGFNSALPVLVFHNYGGGAVPAGENSGGYAQLAMLQVFEPKNGRTSLTNAPDLAVHATIHKRGQTSMNNPKPGLRVETVDEYREGKSVSLLGFPSDNDFVLYGIDAYDKVLIHNRFSHELYRQLGRYSSRTRFVEVYLKDDSGQPGPLKSSDYNGLYVLEEKIKISPDRVAIDKLQPEHTNAPSITGGYIFSVDKSGPQPGFYAADTYMYNLDPDGPSLDTPQRRPQQRYITDYMQAFGDALNSDTWKDPVKGYAAYIDVPAWIDFHMHQVLVFNVDMLRISTYWSKPRNGKVTPAALWDFDRSFGTATSDDQRGFNPWRWHARSMDGGTDPFNASGVYENPWYGKMFKDPDFWQRWIDRYQELRATTYSSSNITALIDQLAAEVSDATPREYARWSGQGASDTTPHRGTVSGDGWTYTFPTPGTYAGEVQFAKTWFTNRLTFMDTNFLARPTSDQPSGAVAAGVSITLSPSVKDGSYIVYTLDGSDPRLSGGGWRATALSNQGPVTITVTNPVRICARSWNASHRNLTGANNPPLSSSWSGPFSATYYPNAAPSIRITEIMYHPAPPPAGDPTDPDEFEYVELTNIGTKDVDLSGYRFIAGIDFVFTSTNAVTRLVTGGQVLVVRNRNAFASRYPNSINTVAGEFGGRLSNSGDHLILAGPFGEIIEDVDYHPRWSPITDGLGFSLVALNSSVPSELWASPSQWRTSSSPGGSPGGEDPVRAAIPTVIVNEILSSPHFDQDDTVELFNPNATPVDISYWYLTDDLKTPKKFLIPPGLAIPGGGFVEFHKTNSFGLNASINALNRTNVSFGLQDDGDQIYLFSGDSDGNLTGYLNGFSFGSSLVGMTWGLHTNSVGHVSSVALASNTLGAANSPTLVGPVVISELMIDPPALISGGVPVENNRDAYIELHNISDQPVRLWDSTFSQLTWRLGGGIHFEFPTNQVLPANGYLLVVNFNPEADPVLLGAFRDFYGLSTNIPVYGPYEGRLNPAGDQVTLRRTDGPDPFDANPPLVRADDVNYGVTAPWPATLNETGLSLHRKDDTLFGDDPANWIAANPTPGAGLSTPATVSLNIELNETGVVLSWPQTTNAWQMEESDDLASPASWQSVSVVPVLQDGRWRVVIPMSGEGRRYYRLKAFGTTQ